jgi:hypothetical protein
MAGPKARSNTISRWSFEARGPARGGPSGRVTGLTVRGSGAVAAQDSLFVPIEQHFAWSPGTLSRRRTPASDPRAPRRRDVRRTSTGLVDSDLSLHAITLTTSAWIEQEPARIPRPQGHALLEPSATSSPGSNGTGACGRVVLLRRVRPPPEDTVLYRMCCSILFNKPISSGLSPFVFLASRIKLRASCGSLWSARLMINLIFSPIHLLNRITECSILLVR